VFFEKLTEHLDWESTCDRASSAASAILNSRPSVTDEPKAAADALVLELERRDRQLRARGAAGFETTDAGGWAALAAAVPELLERRVRLLGCGVTIHGDLRKGGLAS
jgi:hypothetical protein